MKRPFMVWIGFMSICCSKVAKKGKDALGCWYYRKLLKTLKVAQKLPSTIYLCLARGHARKISIFPRAAFLRSRTLLNTLRKRHVHRRLLRRLLLVYLRANWQMDEKELGARVSVPSPPQRPEPSPSNSPRLCTSLQISYSGL